MLKHGSLWSFCMRGHANTHVFLVHSGKQNADLFRASHHARRSCWLCTAAQSSVFWWTKKISNIISISRVCNENYKTSVRPIHSRAAHAHELQILFLSFSFKTGSVYSAEKWQRTRQLKKYVLSLKFETKMVGPHYNSFIRSHDKIQNVAIFCSACTEHAYPQEYGQTSPYLRYYFFLLNIKFDTALNGELCSDLLYLIWEW